MKSGNCWLMKSIKTILEINIKKSESSKIKKLITISNLNAEKMMGV